MTTIFDGFYDKLVVKIGGGWIDFLFPMPPVPEILFLRGLAGRTKNLGLTSGSVGVFGDPYVSVRSDAPVVEALRIIGVLNLDVSKVKFFVHCHADQQESFWQILCTAGVSKPLVKFDTV